MIDEREIWKKLMFSPGHQDVLQALQGRNLERPGEPHDVSSAPAQAAETLGEARCGQSPGNISN